MKAIFVWKVPAGQADEFIKRWKAGSEVFQKYPGAQGTKLLQSKNDQNIFAAIATWKSQKARDVASKTKDRDFPHLKNLETAQLLFSGPFEEVEEIKPPSK